MMIIGGEQGGMQGMEMLDDPIIHRNYKVWLERGNCLLQRLSRLLGGVGSPAVEKFKLANRVARGAKAEYARAGSL
jgi:hypothetical protein